MKRLNFNFKDRKILSVIFCLILVGVCILTIAYAVLSVTLNISGSAQVAASNWDIHFENPVLKYNCATTNLPVISGNSLTFTTTLNMPGDYYEFTVDVVNAGTIDAMIDGVTKIPDLTAEQSKYLTYVIEYQNGEAITTKQLVNAGSSVRLKVKIEYKKDISVTDIPTLAETLNLKFIVNYIQSDDGKVEVLNNGIDFFAEGTEKCFGTECFYIISDDASSVTLLSRYNLYVGGDCSSGKITDYGDEATGIQNSTMLGFSFDASEPIRGSVIFSSENYWKDELIYPKDVYNSHSTIYEYVENYKKYIQGLGVEVINARLITFDELYKFGCKVEENSCLDAPWWIYSTGYWSGTASDNDSVFAISGDGAFGKTTFYLNMGLGVRPVIVISKDYFN